MLQHLAIIMDGNGRWAQAKHLPRTAGHKKGAQTAKEIITFCAEKHIKHLTLYTFSAENWNRPQTEISDLMNLLRFYLDNELEDLHKNGVRLHVVGNLSKLAKDIRTKITHAQELTQDNTNLHLHIALSYGSRQEIINGAQQAILQCQSGQLEPEEITEDIFSNLLYTKQIPDPDLLIRTGGEQRLSNFLLWQLAYTELYFTDILWPDFTSEDLTKAMDDFNQRERRYGGAEEKEAV